jgi:hypothetical protein
LNSQTYAGYNVLKVKVSQQKYLTIFDKGKMLYFAGEHTLRAHNSQQASIPHKKRQRAGAVQDAIASQAAQRVPTGFGVRSRQGGTAFGTAIFLPAIFSKIGRHQLHHAFEKLNHECECP